MKQKRVIVVGGGVAGLVAAIYAKKAGHDVLVLEQGLKTGGLTANWRRRKYHFEGGIHWMFGSSPRLKTIYKYWKEVGGLTKSNPICIEDPIIILYHNRNKLPYHRNLDTFHSEIIRRSPADRNAADILYSDISLFKLFLDSSGGLRTIILRIVFAIPFAIRCLKLWKISAREYASSFTHSEIRTLLRSIVHPDQTAIALILIMAAYSLEDCGYPRGGSMILMANLENGANSNGGTILCRQFVSKVVVQNGKVTGVISNGDYYQADEVIVACDTRKAIDTFFDEQSRQLLDVKIDDRSKDQQCMFVCLGIRADLFRHPMNLKIMLDEPLEAGGATFDCLDVYNYAECDGYAPYKCSSLTIILKADCYDYWMKARNDGTYIEKKIAVLDKVKRIMKQHFPEIENNIEVEEMATPLTYERFTGCHRGGWMSIIQPGKLPEINRVRTKIRGLHFAGRGTMLAGDLSAALLSGRKAAKSIS